MKKIISVVMVLAIVFSFAGCALFSDSTLVKFDDTHSHNDPDGLSYDQRIVLKNDSFASYLEEIVNAYAYPDTMYYDENGSVVGMYSYDAQTGLADGWTKLSDGSFTAFESGKEVDLGKPDESLMISIPGDVMMGSVVYGSGEKAVAAYNYLFYTDAKAKDMLVENLETYFGAKFVEDGENVLKLVQDEEAIAKEFEAAKESGYEVETEDAAEYAEMLKENYMLREYTGENPYKPFEDYTDPEDIDFDQKVVLVGAGEYAVADEKSVQYLSTMTDVVYGKDGKVVAHYTYYQSPSKEACDTLWEDEQTSFFNPVRFSDTVIQGSMTGKDLEELIVSYKGYNILKDDSIDEYVTMVADTYFSVVCD